MTRVEEREISAVSGTLPDNPGELAYTCTIIERKCSGTVAIKTISTHGRWSIIVQVRVVLERIVVNSD